MSGVGPTCCACGNASKAFAYDPKGAGGVIRGLVYIGGAKWICAACTRTAVCQFAKEAGTEARKAAEPPPGFI
jgi:hypothetical protein